MPKRKFTGKVARFRPKDGFGFISIDYPVGRDAYFHLADCENFTEAKVGDRCECFLDLVRRGLKAIRINKV